MERLIKICEQWNKGENITFDDIDYIAYFDLNELSNELAKYVKDTFYNIMSTGNEWNDFDEDYPKNLWHNGYELDGHIYITGYSGVAGKYWQSNDYRPICKE